MTVPPSNVRSRRFMIVNNMKLKRVIFLIQAIALMNCTPQSQVADNEKASTTKTMEVAFLALGDSYTIGESVAANACWPGILVDRLNEDENIGFGEAKIIARTGWTTGDLISAIDRAELTNDYDLVGLLIGVNNEFQGLSLSAYEQEFKQLVVKAVELARGNKEKVFVLSIPDYGYTTFGKSKQEKISASIDRFNKMNREITVTLGVQYFDITPISRKGLQDAKLVAEDGLHPSGAQYAAWVDHIVKSVEDLIRN